MDFDTSALVYAAAAATLTLLAGLIAQWLSGDDLMLPCAILILAGAEMVIVVSAWLPGGNALAMEQGIGLFVGVLLALAAKYAPAAIQWLRK